MTAGPAFWAATVPVSTKMPVPMIAPMPNAVRFTGPSARCSRCRPSGRRLGSWRNVGRRSRRPGRRPGPATPSPRWRGRDKKRGTSFSLACHPSQGRVRRHRQPLVWLGDTDLFVVQVAGGIFLPRVARELIGAHPGVATADVEIAAFAAAALDLARACLEAGHQRIGGVGPDFGEGPLLYIAQGVVPPEGVRVHITQIVDIGDRSEERRVG